MHRTERLSYLDTLASVRASIWTYQNGRLDTRALLATARQAEPGQEFSGAGQTLIRSVRPHGDPRNVWVRDSGRAPTVSSSARKSTPRLEHSRRQVGHRADQG